MSAAGRLLSLALVVAPASASAGAWTRDQGHVYVNLSYSRITSQSLYQLDGHVEPFGSRYTQHQLGLYGEVGIISRWLTGTVEWQMYRNSSLLNTDPATGFRASSEGIGDLRVGVWSGLVTRPLRFSVGFLFGFPLGDPRPKASPSDEAACQRFSEGQGGDGAACDPVLTARSLPTGDGEFDFELRAAIGYPFGGVRRWPLQHYLVAEAGYWIRTNGFPHDFTYKAELGVKFPWRFIDRFWFIGRLSGIEAFVTAADLTDPGSVCQSTAAFSGLGACTTYTAYGFDVAGRIWKGLGASIGLDSAFRARLVAAGANLRVTVSYEY